MKYILKTKEEFDRCNLKTKVSDLRVGDIFTGWRKGLTITVQKIRNGIIDYKVELYKE